MRSCIRQIPICALLLSGPAWGDVVFFSTGDPDGRMAAATRPSSAGKFEIETGDDFVLTSEGLLTSATFTGLLSGGSTIGNMRVEIYRVFPLDSDVGRTSGPPNFSTSQVPTRVNSPSDDAFAERDAATGGLTFSTTILSPSVTAANSVQPGGIHPAPGQTTGGNGPITGQEVRFNVNFTAPLDLPADHYFFVPQVQILDPNGNFYWLSAPRPIGAPGTPFPAGFTDLQAWTRDQFLDPDWLRIGTDIVGGATPPTFNMVFSVTATVIPEPATYLLLATGTLAVATLRRRKLRRS